MDIDTRELGAALTSARDNHDWGDVAEIIAALESPGAYGLDFRQSSRADTSKGHNMTNELLQAAWVRFNAERGIEVVGPPSQDFTAGWGAALLAAAEARHQEGQ